MAGSEPGWSNHRRIGGKKDHGKVGVIVFLHLSNDGRGRWIITNDLNADIGACIPGGAAYSLAAFTLRNGNRISVRVGFLQVCHQQPFDGSLGDDGHRLAEMDVHLPTH